MFRRLAKWLVLLVLGVVAITLASIPIARLESPDTPVPFDNSQALAVDNVNVITMVGDEVLENRQLLLRDGRIEAIRDADFVYTDVWTSMGQEEEAEKRRAIFEPYQVNAELLKHAPAEVRVMHDLPAHRGEEITDEVLDGPRSIVFDQAENRLHAQKAVLEQLLRTE